LHSLGCFLCPSSMAPGHPPSGSHSSHSSHPPQPSSGESAVVKQGDSALASAKRNFSYLINPSTATGQPQRFRTRALLRTLRYVTKFIFWRIVRYAKYVAIGSLVAAIGATAFGSVITGVAWIAAPTSFGASIIAATVWYSGKWGARRLQRKWGTSRAKHDGEGADNNRELSDSPVPQEIDPGIVPW